MNGGSGRATSAWRFLGAAACAFGLLACARSPVLFRGAARVSDLAPDERVVVGRIRYARGGLSRLLPEPYAAWWPRFTYDFEQLQAPRYAPPARQPPIGTEGGVFAFRARQRPVYLHSVVAETLKLAGDHVLWTLPVTVELPASTARCAYVGTIVIDLVGGPPKKPSMWETFRGVELPRAEVNVTIVDDLDRERADLAAYVHGCDLERALAKIPSAEELRPLLEAAAAKHKAEQNDADHSHLESERLRPH